MAAPTLAYWQVRGRAGVHRMLLHYAEAEFEDKYYFGLENGTNNHWNQVDKPALGKSGLDFPNLPYLIDGDVKISESRVILEYLGRKYNLDATNEAERIRIGLAMEVMEEFKNQVGNIAYVPTCTSKRQEVHDTLRKGHEEQLPAKLGSFSKFLGNRKWVAGDRITYVDFFVYEILDWHRVLYSRNYLEADVNLSAYLKRIEELPGVKKFMASPAFIRLPILAPFAMWGQTKDWKPV